jgi:hypothetical protein
LAYMGHASFWLFALYALYGLFLAATEGVEKALVARLKQRRLGGGHVLASTAWQIQLDMSHVGVRARIVVSFCFFMSPLSASLLFTCFLSLHRPLFPSIPRA